ncbi:MAG: hypothetical protein U9Q68_01235 [Euryarchaeota archaeon]|nr:hypothetical protein [Euryarchaeota archaeon]
MQIRFDTKRIQNAPDGVPTPYIKRLVQYWYKPCTIEVHDTSFPVVASLGMEFERPLRFNESVLFNKVDIDAILTPEEEKILEEGLREFEAGKTISLSDLKRDRSEV